MPATIRQREWYYENIEREREKRRTYSRLFRQNNPESRLLQSAKARAKKQGLAFNLELKDIVIPEKCPVFGIPFESKTPFAPSIDRINNTLGYVKGNVWIISRRANELKKDATLKELMLLTEALKKVLIH